MQLDFTYKFIILFLYYYEEYHCIAKKIIIFSPVFQQSEVETYIDRNIWSTLASNIPNNEYNKDILPDSRDIINFVEGSQSILIDTREGIHGELGQVVSGVVKDEQMSGYPAESTSTTSPPLQMSKGKNSQNR